MDEADRQYIKSALDQHGFKFSKSMGQNFLIGANIPEKIARLSGIDKSCGVLEVGPGAGALTKELCRRAGRVSAVELDRRLIPVLKDTLCGYDNVEVIHGDILKLDIAGFVGDKMPGMRFHVCANLPYNITTPAISAFIGAEVFESITVMIQREVARRICAKPDSADYGAFTVYINYHTEPEILFDVPPECFMPRPKVVSSVVTLKTRAVRALEPDEETLFFRVIRASFAQRRKTLVNALHASFGDKLQKGQIAEVVKDCGFGSNVRGETLGLSDFARLSAEFRKHLQA